MFGLAVTLHTCPNNYNLLCITSWDRFLFGYTVRKVPCWLTTQPIDSNNTLQFKLELYLIQTAYGTASTIISICQRPDSLSLNSGNCIKIHMTVA